jgi:membrane-associated phospholipid phosphatase
LTLVEAVALGADRTERTALVGPESRRLVGAGSGYCRPVTGNTAIRESRPEPADSTPSPHVVERREDAVGPGKGVASPAATAALLVMAGMAVMVVDLARHGPLHHLDLRVAGWAIAPDSPWRPLLHVPDGIGLRAVTAPILVAVGAAIGWRQRRWRPFLLALAAVVALNVVVGVLKVAVGRGGPVVDQPDLFIGGMLWPSGHAANIAMSTSLVVHLLRRHASMPMSNRLAGSCVAIPTVLMCTASVILGYHWLSDLVAGVAVGLLVAAAVSVTDERSASFERRARNPGSDPVARG